MYFVYLLNINKWFIYLLYFLNLPTLFIIITFQYFNNRSKLIGMLRIISSIFLNLTYELSFKMQCNPHQNDKLSSAKNFINSTVSLPAHY